MRGPRFARVDVLILDDWGLVGLKDSQRQDLLEILDDRDGARSTIITSQGEPLSTCSSTNCNGSEVAALMISRTAGATAISKRTSAQL